MNLSRNQRMWQIQYLGAFCALGISNVQMAEELAALTESDQEAVHAIGVMRRASQGERKWDLVGSALDSLRALRAATRDTEPPTAPESA